MNHSFKTLLFILAVVVFTSCQREFRPVDTPVIPVPGDGVLLTKYMEIDSVPGAAPDTSTIVTLQYDAQKRLVTLNSFYSTDPAENLIHYEKFVYQYNGTDTFPSRMIYEFKEGNPGSDFNSQKDTSYYSYNAEGKLLTDSTARNSSSNFGSSHYYTKTAYTYYSDFLIVHRTDENNGSIDQRFDTVTVTSSNNNLSSLSAASYSLPDSSQLFSYNSLFSYDNHSNPFHNIPALYPTVQVFDFESGPISLLQKNNAVTISQNSSYNGTSMETITYSYNSNGYPSVFFSTFIATGVNTETRFYKAVFVYN